MPGTGAGNIEEPFVQDIYTFNGTAGQTIYIDLDEDNANIRQPDISLEAPDGTVIFDGPFSLGDEGPLTLDQKGIYRLIVGGNSNDTGTYQFQLWDVPAPDEFAISIGDVVSDGVPGAGAGNIETPGVRDIYSFSGTAGQSIYLQQLDANGLSQLDWQIEAPDGSVVFERSFFYEDEGPFVLDQTGTYRLIVGGESRIAETGTYQLKLWDVPAPDEFTISIGDVVSDGVPGAGAGNIETPGVRDIYSFSGTTGQTIYLQQLDANGLSQLDWQIEAPDGSVVFERSFFYDNEGPFVLDQTGTYRLIVGGEYGIAETGTYQFQIWDVPAPDEFTINIGDVVSDGVPGAGAGNIETPVVQDIYSFSGTAGQTILIEVLAYNGITSLPWVIEAPDGTTVMDRIFRSSSDRTVTLDQTGTYRLIIGGGQEYDDTGTYSFQITVP
jgi:predicted secreted protein/uncharacterized protein YdeI (BOF family)